MRPHYCRVINATGIILHTALGRAALPRQALQQIQEQLGGYSLLQADIATGQRARRETRIQWLLQQLTGAEAATVVNNNAAATAIVLNAVAAGREVIVSRGQLVEIGGSFRLPDVMAASGAKTGRGGHDQQDPRPRLREGHHREHRRDPARPPEQLQDHRLHGRGAAGRIGRRSPTPAESSLIDDVGAGALVDFSPIRLRRLSRRCRNRCGRGPTWSLPAPTS